MFRLLPLCDGVFGVNVPVHSETLEYVKIALSCASWCKSRSLYHRCRDSARASASIDGAVLMIRFIGSTLPVEFHFAARGVRPPELHQVKRLTWVSANHTWWGWQAAALFPTHVGTMRSTTPSPWYKRKPYIHFDLPLSKQRVIDYVTDPRKVVQHSFYPLLGYNLTKPRIRRCPLDFPKPFIKDPKARPIAYPAHMDGNIFHITSPSWKSPTKFGF